MGMRKSWAGAAALCVAVLSGCADPAAPIAAPDAVRNGAALEVGQVGVTVFTVSKWGGKFNLAGGHVVSFAANAICEPLTSTYGPAYWNSSCTPAVLPVTITARSWVDANGRARVDFSPDLRFQPTASAPSRVVLQLKDRNASLDPSMAMLYCPTVGECYDEAAADPSLATHRDSKGAWIYRYVKHFSGYNVGTGRSMSDDAAIAEAGL